MFKWVACLCAAIYFTLLIYGEPPEEEETVAVIEAVEAPAAAAESQEEEPAVEVVSAAVAETQPVQQAAAPAPTPDIQTEPLEPAAQPETETQLAFVAPATTTPKPAVEDAPAKDNRGVGDIWRVTGSVVNLRSAATTQASILGRTQRGESAEMMDLLDNGWAKVYILESGIEAYMSAKFLERETQ